MKKHIPLIAALLAGGAVLPADAAVILSVSPASQTVSLGGQVSIDVLISGLEDGGLDEIVAAYDLSLSFDASILSYSSGTFFDLVDIPPVPDFSMTGVISWNSASFLDDATLQAQQGNTVTLGTLVFDTLSTGTSPLTFTYDDVTGLNSDLLDYSVSNGSATVAAAAAPAPQTALLLGLGALGMLAARRRRATA